MGKVFLLSLGSLLLGLGIALCPESVDQLHQHFKSLVSKTALETKYLFDLMLMNAYEAHTIYQVKVFLP